MLADQLDWEVYSLPRTLVSHGDLIMLTVAGAAIADGDLVVVRRGPAADDGDIVAAMLDSDTADGAEATVKTLARRDGHVWLMPRNPAYAPIPGDGGHHHRQGRGRAAQALTRRAAVTGRRPGAPRRPRARTSEPHRFELEYLAADGERQRKKLPQCWNMRFEAIPPIGKLASYKGQKNFTWLRWTATTGDHVGFRSWLERDNLMLLDFDPAVTGIASLPSSPPARR